MSMLLLAESVGAALLVTGSLIIGIAGIGLVRLGDPFMRMHAATKAGVVGAGLVMLGAGIATGTISGALTSLRIAPAHVAAGGILDGSQRAITRARASASV